MTLTVNGQWFPFFFNSVVSYIIDIILSIYIVYYIDCIIF